LPTGIASIAGPSAVCIGATISLTDATSPGVWSSLAPGTASVGSSTGIVTGVATGTTLITYTVSNSCGSGSVSTSITVNALPSGITGVTNACVGGTSLLHDATSPGTWSSSNTGLATVGSAGLVTGVMAGTDTISYTDVIGCSAITPFTVDITPAAISPSSASVCPGTTATLTESIGGGAWSSSASGTAGVVGGTVSGVAAGTATISYTIGICYAIAPVTVNADPPAITPAGAVSMCVGATASLGDLTPGGIWSSQSIATATVGTSGTVTGVAAGTVNISYTNGFGCAAVKAVTVLVTPVALSPSSAIVCTGNTVTLTDGVGGGTWSSTASGTASVVGGSVSGIAVGTANISYTIGTCAVGAPVTVNLSPNAGSITGPAIVCTGTSASFIDAAAGGIWSSSNNAVATVGTGGLVTGVTAGIVTISYSVTNGCGTATATDIITINASPGAGTIIGASTVCAGTFTTLVDTTSGGVWSSSNGTASISVSGLMVGIIPGTDTISYSVTNTCGTATAAKVVTVGPLLSAGTISGPASVCVGSAITLTDLAPGGVWSSSNTSASVAGGTVTGVSAGTDTISYTVTASCGSAIATQVITVIPIPVAGVISGPTILCAGAIQLYTDAATGGVWGITNSLATISGAGVVSALSPGTDTVTYTVTNACGSASAYLALPIGLAISAGSISGPASVCAGSEIVLTDVVTGGAWACSNASATIIDGTVTGVSPGLDTIVYTVSSSCGSVSTSAIVSVNPLPDAGSISGPSDLCIGTPATYTDAAPGGVWNSSNSTATITSGGSVTPVTPGTDTISYSVTNGCGTATATEVINIFIIPVAGTVSGPSNICVGTSVTLTDGISGGTWSASNGNATVSGGVVSGVSSGFDTISYTVSSSCGTAVATEIIEIDIAPSPGVITGPSGVCIGSLITLADTAIGGAWSASNTDATITTGGLVTGIVPGTDSISYTVTNACGSFSTTHVITIATGLPSAGTITGPGTVCAGAAITLADATPGGVWHSSNSSATVAGGIVTGVTPGTDTISYTVTSGCGSATATAVITITTGLAAGSITGASGVCTGSAITLADAVTGGVWSSSNADATVSGGIVTGVTAGTDTISYTVTGGCGTASATKVITISVSPSAGSITGATGVCAGATTALTDAATGGVWSAANTKATVSVSGVVTGLLVGLDTIRYTVTNACGSASAIHAISINSAPGAGSIAGTASVCPGATVTLTDGVSGGTWSSSNSTIATVSGGTVTGVSSGTATISYTVSNSCGHSSATHSLNVLPDSECSGLQVSAIGNNPVEELKVSPNPNNGAFTMNLVSGIDEEVQVVITNVLGEKVQEFKTTSNKVVDLQMNEAAGIYLLTATTANGRHVAKVIIN